MAEKGTETPTTRGTRALERLGLTQAEVNAYFAVVGKGVCLVSEIGRYAGVPEESAQPIVEKLLRVGLLKEIPGRTIRYQAIPPYSALLSQLEDFRNFITELRQKVPQDLANEFKKFEDGFAQVSGLSDFKKFVLSVTDEIPQQMMARFQMFANKFQSFKQLDEFQKFIATIKNTVPAEMTQKFASFEDQFSRLKEMENFKNFVSNIRQKAVTELTARFQHIETGFTELKEFNELKTKFAEIRQGVPAQLAGSFSKFQTDFKKVAGLEGFKDFVGVVKENLPKKIEAQFSQIETSFSQLKQLQDFAGFVRGVTTSVPQQMVGKFQEFENKFRSVTGLEEFKVFLVQLKQNIPQELAAQFGRFESAIKGVKTALLTTSQDQFSNWMRIFGDIFQEFIEAFVSDVVSTQLEGLKSMFEREVLDAVMKILTKVAQKTETMSEEVLKSFGQIRQWLVTEIITGLKASLEAVNQKVEGASKGVTAGFLELKRWITTEVTGDLERSLTEVDDGATRAAQEVVQSIDKLQGWFDQTVINSLKTILGGLEVKLTKAADEATKSLANVKTWFVKDAIQGIQTTLDATEKNVQVVTQEVVLSLNKLKNWFAGEAVNQLGKALGEVQTRVAGASQEVIAGFAQMQTWVSKDVVTTIKGTLENVTAKVNTAATAIAEEVTKLRELFSERVVANTYKMLSGIEERLWDSEDTMRAFWDKALSEVKSRFQEVWFVEGAEQMVGEIAQIVPRTKSKVLIVAPRLEDIDIVPLRLLPERMNVRIVALIDPKSQAAMKILEEFVVKPNIRFRHYTREIFWGIQRDFEEIILGLLSGEEVYGVGSIVDEHVKTFTEPLEKAWMEGRDIKSVEEAITIQVKEGPRPTRARAAPAAAAPGAPVALPAPQAPVSLPKPTVSPSQIAATGKTSAKETPKAIKSKAPIIPVVPASEPYEPPVKISTPISTGGTISAALQASKQAGLAEVTKKIEEMKVAINSALKGDFGKKLDQLKEMIAMKMGFSRVVFDISKIARELMPNVKGQFTAAEKQDMVQKLTEWKDHLAK